MSEKKIDTPEEQPLPIYTRGYNLSAEDVNKFIELGYTPWQITTSPKRVIRGGNLVTEEVDIIYHFIRKGTAK
jgi:hypothetical protein